MENNVFLFSLCYKRNGKRRSCATMELWMHLAGLLSTQEARVARGNSYASFVLSNLPRASRTPCLHAARLPFLNYRAKNHVVMFCFGSQSIARFINTNASTLKLQDKPVLRTGQKFALQHSLF